MKLSNEEFKERISILVGDEYTVLEQYINAKTAILVRHNKCGHEYHVLPGNFYAGRRCPKCNWPNHDRDTKKFIEEVKHLVGEEYEVLEDYVKGVVPIYMRHNKCGYKWKVTPGHFILNGSRCPKCAGILLKNTSIFKQQVKELVGDEYEVIDEYLNTKTPIKMKHKLCGYIWAVTPTHFLNDGTRCPKCYGTKKKTTNEFIQECNELVGDEYSVIGDYINSRTKIKMKHNSCGYEWDIVPTSFLRGCGCPKCKKSKGEEVIQNWLEKNSIKYLIEFTFEDCKNKRRLPFDFYLPDHHIIIEYDGQHHYELINYGWVDDTIAIENLKRTKKHDQIKDDYCNKHNIPLIRIPYWEFDNIESILTEKLSGII